MTNKSTFRRKTYKQKKKLCAGSRWRETFELEQAYGAKELSADLMKPYLRNLASTENRN